MATYLKLPDDIYGIIIEYLVKDDLLNLRLVSKETKEPVSKYGIILYKIENDITKMKHIIEMYDIVKIFKKIMFDLTITCVKSVEHGKEIGEFLRKNNSSLQHLFITHRYYCDRLVNEMNLDGILELLKHIPSSAQYDILINLRSITKMHAIIKIFKKVKFYLTIDSIRSFDHGKEIGKLIKENNSFLQELYIFGRNVEDIPELQMNLDGLLELLKYIPPSAQYEITIDIGGDGYSGNQFIFTRAQIQTLSDRLPKTLNYLDLTYIDEFDNEGLRVLAKGFPLCLKTLKFGSPYFDRFFFTLTDNIANLYNRFTTNLTNNIPEKLHEILLTRCNTSFEEDQELMRQAVIERDRNEQVHAT